LPYSHKEKTIVNKVDIVKKFYTFENFDESAKYMTDDFQSTNEVGSPPYDQAGWLGMGRMIKNSFPDINVEIDEIREEGNEVYVTSRFGGSFSKDMDLTSHGMMLIPATGAEIKFPSSKVRFSFSGDKISKLHNLDVGKDAGINGLLRAMGVEPK
jgi:hypothetical protein